MLDGGTVSLTLVSPAPLGSTAALLALSPFPLVFRKMAARVGGGSPHSIARLMISVGRSWGLVDEEGALVAAAGLAPFGDGLEIWFDVRPDIGRRIAAVAKIAQLTLAGIAQSDRIAIRARVAAGWAPGQRLARVMRMQSRGVDATGYELWELKP
jgi:hypothetical protein